MNTSLSTEYILGPMLARYIHPPGTKCCEFHLVPIDKRDAIAEPRSFLKGRLEIQGLPPKFKPVPADSPSSLVQIKLQQDDSSGGFASGTTLTESPTTDGLEYEGQSLKIGEGRTVIETRLFDGKGRFRCVHRLTHRDGDSGLRSSVEFTNTHTATLSLELLTSFALNGLSPFHSANSTPHLQFHRFRSWWSLEGRQDSASLESLHFERSWTGVGHFSERFGQVGSMPVRRWFPFAAIEDTSHGVVWASQIAWAGSWQMELTRTGDRLTLCGGLADREFGHWVKHVEPGESFTSPEAFVTVVSGTLDQACQALTNLHRGESSELPAPERDLPVCFNEWCTSWGSPNHENILALAHRLQGSSVKYLVIDDGWAVRPPETLMQSNGDWIVDETKFPGGLKPTCDRLRSMGYIPGIWFEFEVINPAAQAWHETSHQLHRDGRPLQVGSRRFWDFTDPWVHNYLTKKVIHLLRDNRIGYLKVDYNDSIGLGCDHPHSLGEGLRQHIDGVHRFFRKLREEIPDLVIEACSSGGHRLEPSLLGITSMGSFSDAHETVTIPLIARNLQRLILPRQSLIWAVLHPHDSDARLIYSLAATFLGRMCLSGEIHALSESQMGILRAAIGLYEKCSSTIDQGTSTFYGTADNSYVDPRGWQAVVREYTDQVLLIAHTFALNDPISFNVPMPHGEWNLSGRLGDALDIIELSEGNLSMTLHQEFQGGILLFERTSVVT